MARGDVVSEITSVANGAAVNHQPSAGVEWVMKSFAGEANNGNLLYIFDGSLASRIVQGQYDGVGNLTVAVNNAHYIRLHNGTGSTSTLGFTGFISKE
jgi:hypothetical protein